MILKSHKHVLFTIEHRKHCMFKLSLRKLRKVEMEEADEADCPEMVFWASADKHRHESVMAVTGS